MTKDKIKEIRKWYKQAIDVMEDNFGEKDDDFPCAPSDEYQILDMSLNHIPELIKEVKRLKKLLKTKENTN